MYQGFGDFGLQSEWEGSIPFASTKNSGVEQWSARETHILKVASSNLAPATKCNWRITPDIR